MLYDKKGRVIRTNSLNYLGGHTRVDTNYDFIGKALSTKTYHKRSAADTEIEITENFTYTYADRLLKHTHKINSLPVQMLSYNQYDALGRLVLKKVGDVSESQFLQQVDYKYNVRGWLTDINNVNNLAESGQPQDLFAFKIGYNTLTQAHASVEPLYNGNIAQTFWRTASDNIKRSYGYVYDFQNRLRDAYYKIPNSSVNDSYNEHIIYDSNGNILQLSRYGLEEDDTMVYAIDDLLYEYDTGNKLINVMDLTNFSEGFNDGNQKGINGNTDDDFEYDSYGNLIKDRNKEIDEIVYNHLNLPKKIIFENENTIEYLYDASGTKLRKIVTDNTTSPTTVTTTHYLDGFQYSEDKLDFFPTIEGYVHVTYNSSTPGGPLQALYNYVYNYTDHLGNIRLRYTKNPGTGGGLRILEEDHYYPFGLKHQGYNNEHNIFEPGMPGGEPVVIVPVNPLIGDKYKYKFNGMEWQNELDLNFYDFGMRNYDPALGRWMNIDPLAEIARRWSPYTYVYNNPVLFVDPDGMMANLSLNANNQATIGQNSFVVTTFGHDGSTLDSQIVKDLDNVGIGLDGNVYTNQNDLQTANQGVMRDVLVAADINPDAQPEQDLSEIDMLVEKVPELSRLKEEGGNPKFKFGTGVLHPNQMGEYDHPSRTAYISTRAFVNYLTLAFTVGHELSHAVHFHSGLYIKWINASHFTAAKKYSEYLAYKWERDWGNPGSSGYMNKYKNEIGGWFNRLERIKK